MNSRLDQFINDHRDSFDDEEPSGRIWGRIEQGLEREKKQQAPVIKMGRIKWSVAAAVLVIMGTALFYLAHKKNDVVIPVAANNNKPASANPVVKEPAQVKDSGTTMLAQTDTKTKDEAKKEMPATDNQANDMNEEMYHFAKLVEIKHRELRKIEKDEPLLYRQFAGDVNKLDSVYHSLEVQLPENPNREQLIEAMIQNLQLQMDLLNHQLTIIKQINHSKKSAYEQAFKST